jgi:putative PEP-CTERM system TPR-repeat lipoprotein
MKHFCFRHVLLCSVFAVLGGCGESPDALMASAKDYLANNDTQAAVIQLKNTLQKEPDRAEARFLLGKTLLELGDAPGAEKELARAAALQYDREQVTPLWARALVLTNEHQKVVDELAKVELSNPRGKAELMTVVGDAHLAQGNIRAARDAFNAARTADPTYPPPLRGEAQVAVLSRDLKEASTKVDAALAIAPNDWQALELKGDVLMAGNQREKALAAYRQATAARPDAVRAHGAIITLLMQERKVDDAAKQVDEMKQAAPNHPQTAYFQAWLAYEQKDFAAARTAVQKVLTAAPDNLRALLLAGAIEYQLQSYVQAEDYLSKVLARAPSQPFAWRLLIESYVRRGQAGRALEKLQPVLNQIKTQNDPGMLMLAGEVLMMNGDAKQASEYFGKAAKLDPKNARSRTSLALTHIARGESDTALRELEQAASTGSDVRADVALIAAHVRQREFDKALAAVDRLQKKQPGSPVPHHVRGGVLLAKGDRAAARQEFQRALEINPGYFPAAAQLAQFDLADKKPDAARQRFESVLAKDPRNLSAMVAIAELRARAGAKPEEVVALLQKAISVHPAAPAARLNLIAYQIRIKDFKNAMLTAQQAMAAIPDNPQVLAVAGQAHQVAGETNQAISIYRKLAALEPKSAVPYLRMADAQFAAKQTDDAIENLRKALDLDPDFLHAQQGLARVYVESGRAKEAIAVAREVQKQRPKEPIGYALEGDIHASQKNWAEAASAYRTGLKQSDSTHLAMRLHAVLGAGAGGANAASDFAATWLKTHPKDQAFRMQLAQSALATKQYAVAVEHYRKVLETAPKNAIVLNNLAWAEAQINDPKALEHAEEANRIAPNQPPIMDTLGVLLVDKGQTARGLELLQKAAAQAPQAPGIRLNYAKALIKAGQKEAARKELDELGKLGDQFPAQAEVDQLRRGL